MKKNLFEISQEEKQRMLNLHETATKKQYLKLNEEEKPSFEKDYGSFVYLSDTLNPVKVKKKFEEQYGIKFEVQRLADRLKVIPKQINEQDSKTQPTPSHIPDVKEFIQKTVNFYKSPATVDENYYGTAKILNVEGLAGLDVVLELVFDEGTDDEVEMEFIMDCQEFSKNPNSGFLTGNKKDRYYNKALNLAIGQKFCKAPKADFQAKLNKPTDFTA